MSNGTSNLSFISLSNFQKLDDEMTKAAKYNVVLLLMNLFELINKSLPKKTAACHILSSDDTVTPM